ncbi:hypothetical protein [Bacillus thuringiensis]
MVRMSGKYDFAYMDYNKPFVICTRSPNNRHRLPAAVELKHGVKVST